MKRFYVLSILVIAFSGCEPKAEPAKTDAVPTEKESVKEDPKPDEEHKGQASVKDGVSEANALQVAKSLPDFSTLVTAIEAAGVEDAVVNAGPLTIFAPANTAFEKLPEGTVETLLKPENKSKLAFILTNHVAPANYTIHTLKKNVKKKRKLYMASGEYLEVTQEGDDIFVAGTKILKSVNVSNGWIHVIDDVLVPAEK